MLAPEPKQENSTSTDSVNSDKKIDTSIKATFTDINGEYCVKKLLSAFFCFVGICLGLIIFYRGLSNPEADYVGSYEVFQFFIVSGLAGLGLSTVENLFKKK